jgi:5-oxopent-3-ene-1,2,5-tricarboxylate decarboxylase / 2-hydroxyhepta-2,4-diene-1,7-dioate isomerase
LLDITDFMTLKAGDILLLGPSFRSPAVKVGQTIELRSPQFGTVKNTVVKQNPIIAESLQVQP